MKKFKLVCVIFSFLFMSACSTDNSEEKYVKNILFNKTENEYVVMFEYYDFSSDQENYFFIQNKGEDIEKMSVDSVKKHKLNFRLCENIYISPVILDNETGKVFYTINSLRIPVDTNIICCLSDGIPENTQDIIMTKLYNFSINGGKVSGTMSIYDENGAYSGGILLSQNKIVKYLPENQWKILNVLTSNNHSFTIQFRNGHMVAELENCTCFTDTTNKTTVNISARLKNYNGVANSILQEDLFKDLLRNEIKNIVSTLYNDTVTVKECNLYWFLSQKTILNNKIDINVMIY